MKAMKPVTKWECSEHRGRSKWEHNHIEDGHVPESQAGPIAKKKFPDQAQSWKNRTWRKQLTYQRGQRILRNRGRWNIMVFQFWRFIDWLWHLLPDKCEMPDCNRHGVRGNENIIDGRIVCDYCHAKTLPPSENVIKHWSGIKPGVDNRQSEEL